MAGGGSNGGAAPDDVTRASPSAAAPGGANSTADDDDGDGPFAAAADRIHHLRRVRELNLRAALPPQNDHVLPAGGRASLKKIYLIILYCCGFTDRSSVSGRCVCVCVCDSREDDGGERASERAHWVNSISVWRTERE